MNEKTTFERILNILNDFKDDGEKISSKRRNTRFSRANFVNEWISGFEVMEEVFIKLTGNSEIHGDVSGQPRWLVRPCTRFATLKYMEQFQRRHETTKKLYW
jgi:hypothetical protein